jgi:hypothetical protein
VFPRLYVAVGSLLLAGYAYAGFTGWEPSSPERVAQAGTARQSPGGYRSFWFSGWRGGK